MCIIIYEGVFANRKSIFSKILSLIICLFLVFSTFSANVFALNEDADLDMNDDIIISNKLDFGAQKRPNADITVTGG